MKKTTKSDSSKKFKITASGQVINRPRKKKVKRPPETEVDLPPMRKLRAKSWNEVKGNKNIESKYKELSGAAKEYPPPKNSLIFKSKWIEFIGDVSKRDNFKPGHLSHLEILCDLFEEYGSILEGLNEVGYTYTSKGRNGIQIKENPLIAQLNKTRLMILNYTKLLGLVVVKDKELTDPKGKPGETEDDWD